MPTDSGKSRTDQLSDALADKLERTERRLSVPDRIQLRQVLHVFGDRAHHQQRAMIASVLARSADEWQVLARAFDDLCAPEPKQIPQSQPSPQPPRTVGSTITYILLSLRSGWRLCLLFGSMLGLLILALFIMKQLGWIGPPSLLPKVLFASAPKTPELLALDRVNITEYQPARIIYLPSTPLNRVALFGRAVVALLCGLLAAIGVQWMLLPRRLRRFQLQSAEQRRRTLFTQEEDNRSLSMRPAYKVQPILPVSIGQIEACGVVLGRLTRGEAIGDLDLPRTIAATASRAGHIMPIYMPRPGAGELVVLVDLESGDHPWLCQILALLDLWERQGVRLVRFGFRDPLITAIEPMPNGSTLPLAALANRHADAPLLICSRTLKVSGINGELADWPTKLGAFAVRAWLDLDPYRLSNRSPKRRTELRHLVTHARLPRFPLTEKGLTALVQHLAGDGRGTKPLEWPPLSISGKQHALRKWAMACALVPDPTWDQVQALRAAIPELKAELPEPRYVQLLIDSIRTEFREDPERTVGVLHLSVKAQEQLVSDLRKCDGGPQADGFERRVHQVLLGQLAAAPAAPDGTLARWLWEWAYLRHSLPTAPVAEAQRLQKFVGSPLEQVVAHWLRQTNQDETLRTLRRLGTEKKEVLALLSPSGYVTLRSVIETFSLKCFNQNVSPWIWTTRLVLFVVTLQMVVLSFLFSKIYQVSAQIERITIIKPDKFPKKEKGFEKDKKIKPNKSADSIQRAKLLSTSKNITKGSQPDSPSKKPLDNVLKENSGINTEEYSINIKSLANYNEMLDRDRKEFLDLLRSLPVALELVKANLSYYDRTFKLTKEVFDLCIAYYENMRQNKDDLFKKIDFEKTWLDRENTKHAQAKLDIRVISSHKASIARIHNDISKLKSVCSIVITSTIRY